MQRRGVSQLISFVLLAGIVISAIGLALTIGLPQIAMLDETASIENSITALTELDRSIREVATEGQYSSRTVSLRFRDGQYRFDPERETFYYELTTDSDIISTHATRQLGPVHISANTDVNVYETTVNGINCYMMENQRLEACIRAIPETFDPDEHPYLLGYWRMNEGEGSWANDSSRYRHHGTLEDTPVWTDGVYGDALEFDGSEDYLLIDYNPALTVQDGNWSVSAWIRQEEQNREGLISQPDSFWLYIGDDGAIGFQQGHDPWEGVWSQSAIQAGEWHHVTATHDSSNNATIYINGEHENSGEVNFGLSSEDLYIGSWGGEENFFNGVIDEVRIYNRSLTEEEVRWQYLQRGDLNYMNTSELLVHLHNKRAGETLDGTLHTYIDEDMETRAGRGSVTTDQSGEQVGRGQITANVTTDNQQYDIDYQLMSGADFLVARSAADTVTAALETVLDAPGDPVYIDGTQRMPGVYTTEDISFGYGVAEAAGLMTGLVAGSGFTHVGYESGTEQYRVNVTNEGSSIFLLPFSTGTHADVQEREELIRDGVHGAGRFFGYPSPSFAYDLTEEKTVRTALSYDTIHLWGPEQTIAPGTHDIRIENHGAADGQANVSVTVQ